MTIRSFKAFMALCEGGNVVITDIKGREIPAEKIDLSKFNRSKFTKDMLDAFMKLNSMFEKEYGVPIWKNLAILKNGFVFNGSSETFFSPDIPDEDYVAVKPKVGDIDVTVPDQFKEQLWKLLKKIKGKKITSKVKYAGDNRPNYSPGNAQINSVLEYNDGKNIVQAQVDFELTKYDDDSPSEFDKFGHPSSWKDM